jgi:Flp pilus assembly protein TadD
MGKRSKKRKIIADQTPADAGNSPADATMRHIDWRWALALIGTVFLAYIPVWWAGYVWDDNDHLTANPCIVGPLGFLDIWTTAQADISPLTQSTFWLEHAIWGLTPLPYHLINVLLHGACAVVLWQVLRNLRILGAWLGAALWALHPVQVESVAWITEMKNTESGFFYLLSIWFYLKWSNGEGEARTGREWNYPLALLFAALAMACKSSTVILPVVLCLCAWWKDGIWKWRDLARTAPIFLMSIIASGVTMWTQKQQFAIAVDARVVRAVPERLAGAGDAVWFYLGKVIWPHPLVTIYPHWQIDTGSAFSYLPLLAVIALLLILWIKRASWSRPWLFAFAYFLVALLPVLGLVDNPIFRYSLVFDHLQYLASIGPLALVGAGFTRWTEFAIPENFALRTALAAGLLSVLACLSWQRSWVYENRQALWTDTLIHSPDSWAAHNGLGNALLENGNVDEAITQFRDALKIDPNYVEAYDNLGSALVKKGHITEAIEHFEKAIELQPAYSEAHYNLGNALLQKGRADDAISEFHEALKINPSYAEAHYNLGSALLDKGEIEGAMSEYRKAVTLKPDDAEAHMNLGDALLQLGQVDDATAEYRKAISIRPNYADAYNNLGLVYAQQRQVDEAKAQFQKAIQLDPNLAEAHRNLGVAYFQEGQVNEAIDEFRALVQLKPNDEKAKLILAKAQEKARQMSGAP